MIALHEATTTLTSTGVNGVQESLATLNVFSVEGAAPLLIHHFSQGLATDTSWSLTDTLWVQESLTARFRKV